MTFVHELFLALTAEQNADEQKNPNREKLFFKTTNFSGSTIENNTKQVRNDHCPLTDGSHKFFKFPIIQEKSVIQEYSC